MADSEIQPEQEPQSTTTPLLVPHKTQEEFTDTHLNRTITRLQTLLYFMGFHQPSLLGILLSWIAFLVVGVLVPALIIGFTGCPSCTKYMISTHEFYILVFQACLAAVSLLCISHNLRKRGLRRFLFVDRENGHTERFHEEYAEKIQVISIAQVVGIVLSLHAAAKISHRAQGLASVASRWHALVTCGYTATSQSRMSNSSMGNVEASTPGRPLSLDFSESDLESLETVMLSTNTQIPSYHKRQAFVMYLQANVGGVTIFGWTIDRAMINTVFFIELSLVTFVLGKTILLTTI